jgi:hypothetical protein
MRCNLVRNDLANPNDVLYSFTSGSASYGDLLNERPSSMYFSKVPAGVYSELVINFCDQSFQSINIKDSQLLITIIIKSDSV